MIILSIIVDREKLQEIIDNVAKSSKKDTQEALDQLVKEGTNLEDELVRYRNSIKRSSVVEWDALATQMKSLEEVLDESMHGYIAKGLRVSSEMFYALKENCFGEEYRKVPDIMFITYKGVPIIKDANLPIGSHYEIDLIKGSKCLDVN